MTQPDRKSMHPSELDQATIDAIAKSKVPDEFKHLDNLPDSPDAFNDAKQWLYDCRNYAAYLCRCYGEVSADKVLNVHPRPANISPNATGSLFKDKRFKLVGYKQSTKTSAHARRIGIYQLNEGYSE